MSSTFARIAAFSVGPWLLASCGDPQGLVAEPDSPGPDAPDVSDGDTVSDTRDQDSLPTDDDVRASDSAGDHDTGPEGDGSVASDVEDLAEPEVTDDASGADDVQPSDVWNDGDIPGDVGLADAGADVTEPGETCSGLSIMVRFAPHSSLFAPVYPVVTEQWAALGVFDASGLRADAALEPTVSWPREARVYEFGDCGDTDGLTCFRTPVPEDYTIAARVRLDGRECDVAEARVVVTPADDIYVVMLPDPDVAGNAATLPRLHAAPEGNRGTMFDSSRDNPTAPSFDRDLVPRFPYACTGSPCVEVFILDDWPTYAYEYAVDLPAAATGPHTVTVRGFANGREGLDITRTLEPGEYWYVADTRRSYASGFAVQDVVTRGAP